MKIFAKTFGRLYNKLKLQTKFTITHLVIATLPLIVLSIFFYTKLYGMIVADTIRTEQNASTLTAPLIGDEVSQILKLHSKIANQEFFRQIVDKNRGESLGELAASKSAHEFLETLDRSTDGSPVKDIKLYIDIPQTDPVFSTSLHNTVLPMNHARGTYWYGIFNGSPAMQSLFCPSFYLGSYEIRHNGDLAYITKSNIVYEGKQRDCYLAIYFTQEYFENLLKENLTSAHNVAYIINKRDSLVATTDRAMSGTYHFSYGEVQEHLMSSNNFILKKVLKEDVYAGFYSIKNTDWYMVVAMPSKPMISKSIGIMTGFILVYVACIIIAFLIATLLSHSITGRLSAVINQMALSRIEPPVALPASDTFDEIGDLISTYNYMTRIINQLMDEQAKAAEDLRVAEFNSLQSQINPHFLYNTMDMINWLSKQGRSQEVTSAIQKLSRFYKLTLSRKHSLSTIADEIEHVSIYVQLQNMRFHDTIDFLVDIPDDLAEYPIPKLTFQPVIENCILHGILEKESKQGTIVLTGWMEDKTIVILISDDGVGISKEKLDYILTGRGISKGKGSNIAVYNTHRRLQLMYGAEYGLTYSGNCGEGTEVEIRIPAQYPDEEPAEAGENSDSDELLKESRFVQAMTLLTRPEINIYEIPDQCGFDDPQQFFAEFRKRFGCSPEEYRRQVM